METPDSEKKEKSGSDTEMENVSSMLSELSLSSLAQDECFISHQHAEKSLEKMEYYFLKEQLTDVVIIAGKRRIPAHKLVLSAGSDYFAAMFRNDLKEASQSEIELHNVDGDALWALMHYCYTGKIELVESNVEALLGTACLLQLTEVVEACSTFLKKLLHPSNCIGIRIFADSQGCTDLLEVSQNYTEEHFCEVIKNQEFLMLSADEVAKLLASNDLNVSSEEVIFHALMSWLEYDLPNRTEHVSKLLSLVKVPLLSPSFIVDHIETVPLFRDNPECRELIVEAFKYHLLPDRRLALHSSRTCARKSTVGDLYALGGMGANKSVSSVEKYDVRLDRWFQFRMIFRRQQCGVAVVDDTLYVVGGRDGLKTLNTFESVNIKTKTLTNLTPMSTARHGLGVGVLEGPLYAVGGHDGWSFLNTVERWDPQTKAWSYVTPMSTQRSTAGVAVLNGKLYAVGGRDGSCCLKTVECYDPHTNKWMPCASMTKRRGGVGVGVLNGYLYALGGHEVPGLNNSAERLSCVERYDPKSDSWTMVASMMTGRDAIGVCAAGERLFAVGGYDGRQYLKLVETYDPQKNKWEEAAPLISERAGACVVVIGRFPNKSE